MPVQGRRPRSDVENFVINPMLTFWRCRFSGSTIDKTGSLATLQHCDGCRQIQMSGQSSIGAQSLKHSKLAGLSERMSPYRYGIKLPYGGSLANLILGSAELIPS